MKILDTRPFSNPIICCPGDTLRVTWSDNNKTVARMEATITEDQTLDTAVLVKYTPEEAEKLGFESALGVFAGKAEDLT
jgi:hypothetical protein